MAIISLLRSLFDLHVEGRKESSVQRRGPSTDRMWRLLAYKMGFQATSPDEIFKGAWGTPTSQVKEMRTRQRSLR